MRSFKNRKEMETKERHNVKSFSSITIKSEYFNIIIIINPTGYDKTLNGRGFHL